MAASTRDSGHGGYSAGLDDEQVPGHQGARGDEEDYRQVRPVWTTTGEAWHLFTDFGQGVPLTGANQCIDPYIAILPL